jgi:hypothetical protein
VVGDEIWADGGGGGRVALDDAEESWSGKYGGVAGYARFCVSLRNFQLVPTVNARGRR